jgi:hypothetical protein
VKLQFNSRFYFVGDEDLLEIIGNSKNVARLQKHFKKMFAGVAAILLNEDNTVITGIASREGEEVKTIYINCDDFNMFTFKFYINFELRGFLEICFRF